MTTMRVGTGFDQHPFVEGRPLVLGCVVIVHHCGLGGHSDADALSHAIVDALLGASALGDIGTHFPSSDERWKGRASRHFLEATARLLREDGWTIGNVDSTILAQRPVLAPYVARMRTEIAAALAIEPGQVSVKAKTGNGLGAVGREEGIACQAIAMIDRPRSVIRRRGGASRG